MDINRIILVSGLISVIIALILFVIFLLVYRIKKLKLNNTLEEDYGKQNEIDAFLKMNKQ